jgi:hypothetical protein
LSQWLFVAMAAAIFARDENNREAVASRQRDRRNPSRFSFSP